MTNTILSTGYKAQVKECDRGQHLTQSASRAWLKEE